MSHSRIPVIVAAFALFAFLAYAALAAEPSFEDLARDARTALDTARPDEALELFNEAATLAPERAESFALDRAWAYVQKAYAACRMQAYDEAAEDCAKAVAIYPGVSGAVTDIWAASRMHVFWPRYRTAAEDTRSADWQPLIDYAAETAALVPDWPEARTALGAAFDGGRQAAKAEAEYRAAAGRSAGPEVSVDALRKAAYEAASKVTRRASMPMHPLLGKSEPGAFKIYRHGRFVVRHHNAEVAERMALALEYYASQPVLAGLLDATGASWKQCDVYIYRNHEELGAAPVVAEHKSAAYGWATGYFHYSASGPGAGKLELHLQQDVPDLFELSAPHELAHLRFAMLWPYTEGIPAWVLEGVAKSGEPRAIQMRERRMFRDAAERGTLGPIAEVLAAGAVPQDDGYSLFYAESLALVNTLIERGGSKRFIGFLELLGRNDAQSALKTSYGIKPEYFRRLALDWASGRPVTDAAYAEREAQRDAKKGTNSLPADAM